MRGIGCLLTGVELFPGNIQGGSRHARRLGQRHLDRSGNQELPASADPATRTRFGSLEFGVMVPDRADTWTRMVYAGANKPLAPIDDPYQMFDKLYGRAKDQENLEQRARRSAGRLAARSAPRSARRTAGCSTSTPTFVREMEQELQATPGRGAGHAVPALEPGVKQRQRQHAAASARCRST